VLAGLSSLEREKLERELSKTGSPVGRESRASHVTQRGVKSSRQVVLHIAELE
jgi:hypothetical protein